MLVRRNKVDRTEGHEIPGYILWWRGVKRYNIFIVTICMFLQLQWIWKYEHWHQDQTTNDNTIICMMTKSLILKKSRSPSPTPELPSRGRCHHNRRLCLQIMIMQWWLCWLMMCWLMISLIIINNLIKSCNIVSTIIITEPSVMNTTISNTVCFVPGRMTPPEICVSSAELSFYWQEGEIATTGKSNRWIC